MNLSHGISTAEVLVGSYGKIEAESEAESESPMLMPILDKELSSVTYYSPEELKYMAAQELKSQPLACAVVKRLEEEPQSAKIQHVPDWPYDENKVKAVHASSRQANPNYYLSMDETRAHIESRQQKLEQTIDVEPDLPARPALKPTGRLK